MNAAAATTPTPISPDFRDLVFRWSTPAPAWDGSPIKPWRVAHKDQMRDLLVLLGYDNARAYVDYLSHSSSKVGIFVGIRDNRDPVAHSVEIVKLAAILSRLNFAIRFEKSSDRITGIRCFDHNK